MLKLLLRPFVGRYIAGESTEEALTYAKKLRSKKIIPIFDILGEHATKKAEMVRVMGQYLQLLEKMREQNVRGDISLKLTAFGLEIDPLLCYRAVLRVVAKADEQNTLVWVDMENSPYTQQTIRIYRKLRAQHENVGICIQTDLKRARRDVLSLALDKPRIRLVKGAYPETSDLVYDSHRKITENFKELLKLCVEKNAYAAVATHDMEIISYALHLHPKKERIEFQLLMGVREDEKKMLVEKGFLVKEYVPFGSNWEQYFLRRVLERWRNVWWMVLDKVGIK